MSFDLFEREEKVIKRGRALCEATEFDVEATRAALPSCSRSTKGYSDRAGRLVRISDRNEAELNAMAEKQRLAARRSPERTRSWRSYPATREVSFPASLQIDFHRRAGGQARKPAEEAHRVLLRFAGFGRDHRQDGIGRPNHCLNHYLTGCRNSSRALERRSTSMLATHYDFFGDRKHARSQGRRACMRENGASPCRKDAGAWRVLARLRYRDAASMSDRVSSPAIRTVGNFGSEDRMDYTIIGGPVNSPRAWSTKRQSAAS